MSTEVIMCIESFDWLIVESCVASASMNHHLENTFKILKILVTPSGQINEHFIFALVYTTTETKHWCKKVLTTNVITKGNYMLL